MRSSTATEIFALSVAYGFLLRSSAAPEGDRHDQAADRVFADAELRSSAAPEGDRHAV
ncbi:MULTISPECIES: hypothetical protein [Streptomyces]|uniref:hypothetical protein n=1 Tax=Streptomyces TaxID=1883 RepID=UPI0037ABADCD